MFDKKRWSGIEFRKYSIDVYNKTKDDNPILKLIDPNKFKLDSNKKSPISGIPFAIKDNFLIDSVVTTNGSKILDTYLPNFSSEVFNKLVENGGVPIFKSNLDELGMGGTGLTSAFGIVRNPLDKTRISGGSSSGSGYLVATKLVDFSIGTDTGDSIRKPAIYLGIVGFKPTKGLVSRNGVIDFSPSLDTVGWFTNSVKNSAILLDILQGFDKNDGSSVKPKQKDFANDIETSKKYKLGYFSEMINYLDNDSKSNYLDFIKKTEEKGHKFIKVKANNELLRQALNVYRIISFSDSFSSNSNLIGFLFGKKDNLEKGNFEEKIIESRKINLKYEVKKRFMFSHEILDNKEKILLKAKKISYLIRRELEKVYSQCDALVLPGSPTIAHKIDDMKYFAVDDYSAHYLSLFNINGSPSISIPTRKNDNGQMPLGVNISTRPFEDKEMFQVANAIKIYE